MRTLRRILAVLLMSGVVAGLSLAPVMADARPGSGSASLGSRGSRTWSPSPGMAPMQRSTTPTSPSQPSTGPVWSTPGWSQPGAYTAAPSFWRAVAGGFAGAWLMHMLFGGYGGWGYGGYGMHLGGLFGTFLMVALVICVGRAVWRGVFGPGPVLGPRAAFLGTGYAAPMGGYQPMARPLQQTSALDDRDFSAFGRILTGVQETWSRGDVEGLRRLITPEMLAYFADMLANNASQGVANRVEQVALVHGEPRESWREGAVDYATCRLTWRAVDYTHRLDRRPSDPGFIVDGDPYHAAEVSEFWTFRRMASGYWLLSAIQQAA